ncbi:MAG TPA: GNAT family N-acetyltransferase [Hyphomicrobiales bacterium]|nr:GNAT family N-acetyltransferase [Hyphomicrobiales bacterium]
MIDALPPEALVLETERLRLRPFAAGDADLARALLCDPEVMRHVADPLSAEQVESIMPNITRRGAGGRLGIWCVSRKDTGEPIGDGVLTPLPIDQSDVNWDQLVPDAYPSDPVEVGYLLRPEAWGQGFATEICRRLLRFGFEMTTLDTIVACTDIDNHASQRVLRKAGMRHCGTRRAYGEDGPWFEMTRAEWQKIAERPP